MGKLFGTDGVRGIANTELSCDLALNLGRAGALVLTKGLNHKPKVIIGKDTRISSDMLESALVAGLCSVGADAVLLGVVPTPAVAYLCNKYNADAGVMISASHNPYEFNGIKLFNSNGVKLSDEIEAEIEEILLNPDFKFPTLTGSEIGHISVMETAKEDYINHITKAITTPLDGLKIVLDTANGSSSHTAYKMFSSLGADVTVINNNPNGVNINDNCGSTHIEMLMEEVKNQNADLGLAFDGDADRCLAVDENGELVDGDKMIAIMTKELKDSNNLKNNTVVVTVMSNLGLFEFCKKHGIESEITAVGDRYVLENMLLHGHNIGGEQSGHIIFADFANTGDGQLSGAFIAQTLKKSGKKMSELAQIMEKFPQVMINNHVSNDKKKLFDKDKEVCKLINEYTEQLGDDGRILVRASGTEPLIRVMVEGKNLDEITKIATEISDKIKERLS